MKFVRIKKSGIESTADVPETALPHWEAHGWSRVDDAPEAAHEPADEAGGATQQEAKPSAPARASRRSANVEVTEE